MSELPVRENSGAKNDVPCVSVIIPVYNSEDYLKQCLDSIVSQTLENIEIICVDDGSTDCSVDILREYAQNDARIQIIEQSNQHAGVARNNGMKVAAGEYLAFWDSDDYFELTALEKMYRQCKSDDADLCVCGASRIIGNVDTPVRESFYLRKKLIPESVPFNRNDIPDHILTFTNAAPWNKLYRRSFVEENDIRFSTAANSEDVYFVEVALCLAHSITIVDESLVVYRRDRPGSLTNTIDRSQLTSLKVWVETAQRLRELGVYPETSFANRAASNVAYMLRNQKSYESFALIIAAMKEYALKELSLSDTSILDVEWHRDLYNRVRDDAPEDVLMYLMNYTYIKLTEASMKNQINKRECARLKKGLKKAQESERKLRASNSYKLGRAATWLPRKAKRILRSR